MKIVSLKKLATSAPDYQMVVEPLYREAIVKRLQKTYKYKKNKLLESPETFSDLIPYLKEPIDNGFLKDLETHVKNNTYHLIDYRTNDFERRLFQALRLGLISMNEMLSVLLMYKALLCFNQDTIPERGEVKFSRFVLGDKEGPYQPEQEIPYWDNAATEELNALLKEANKHYYYTIDLPPGYAVELFHNNLLALNTLDFKVVISVLDGYLIFLNKEIERLNDKEEINIRLQLISNLEGLRQNLSPLNLNAYWSAGNNVDSIMNAIDRKQLLSEHDLQNINFMSRLSRTLTFVPMICTSPSLKDTDPKNEIGSFLSFVLPTIDTLNRLQKMVHRDDMTQPVPVVGRFGTRMVLAYDENLSESPELMATEPANEYSTHFILKALFPNVSQIKSGSARPIEVTHPDTEKTKIVHGYECHDFLLIWHDMLHCWKSGSQYKKIIQKLRALAGKKEGFLSETCLMSKTIWRLSDMDSEIGVIHRASAVIGARHRLSEVADKPQSPLSLLVKYALKFGFTGDNYYLLLYDFIKFPEIWKSILPGLDLEAERKSSSRDLKLEFEKLDLIQAQLHKHPNASVVEIILRIISDKSPSEHDRNLVEIICSHLDLKKIFIWLKDGGIHVRDKTRAKKESEYFTNYDFACRKADEQLIHYLQNFKEFRVMLCNIIEEHREQLENLSEEHEECLREVGISLPNSVQFTVMAC